MIEIRTSTGQAPGINITPLVDIVFLLLIFFLLTAFFIKPEGIGINLPQARGEAIAEPDEILVIVTAAGVVQLGNETVTLDELERRVAEALKEQPTRPVVVKADRKVALQAAVSVMESIKRAGADRIVIATETPPERGGAGRTGP